MLLYVATIAAAICVVADEPVDHTKAHQTTVAALRDLATSTVNERTASLLKTATALAKERDGDFAIARKGAYNPSVQDGYEVRYGDGEKVFLFANAKAKRDVLKLIRVDAEEFSRLVTLIEKRDHEAAVALYGTLLWRTESHPQRDRFREALQDWKFTYDSYAYIMSPAFRPFLPISGLRAGMVGTLDYEDAKALQVIDGSNMLVSVQVSPSRRVTVWVTGISTDNVTDGKPIAFGKRLFYAADTKTYGTAVGGTNTVFVLSPAAVKGLE